MSPVITSKKNFLFDLDGTLVDSNEFHRAAFYEVLTASAPQFLPGFDYENIKGWKTRDVFANFGLSDDVDIDALTAAKQAAYFRSINAQGLPLIPGARELLDFLRSRNIRMYVVSAGSRHSVEEALHAAKIDSYFSGTVTSDEVARSKPNPEIYLKCLAIYGLNANDCVAVEDSESGVTSSVAAGIDSVLVNTDLEFPGALGTFAALEQFTDYAIQALRSAA